MPVVLDNVDGIPRYCTDEDIAIETADYRTLCPRDQLDAYGTDGFITPEAPWTLVSPIVDFARNGVKGSTIVFLTKPETVWGPEPGESFAVATVDPGNAHAIVLRRKGKAVGLGDPPGDGVNEISGVEFTIYTLDAQIIKATQEIDAEFNISRAMANNPGVLLRADALTRINRLCIYRTIGNACISVSKGTTVPGAKDVYMEKGKDYLTRYQNEAGHISMMLADDNPVRARRPYARINRIS